MTLIYINNLLFLLLVGWFAILLFVFITLIIYFVKYVRNSSEDKRIIYTELNNEATPGSIVFLGDSLTDFYRTSEFFLNLDIYNRGIAGDKTTDVLDRLSDNVLQIKPRKIFLQIGTNDLGSKTKPDQTFNNIKQIIFNIQRVLPDTEVLVISLYPINPYAIPLSRIITRPRKNTDILYVNQKLMEFCAELNLTYIDVCSSLKDEKGNLKKEYTIEGLHISLPGYAKITEILKPYVF
jgi:lysophospholipase L1-like esterase